MIYINIFDIHFKRKKGLWWGISAYTLEQEGCLSPNNINSKGTSLIHIIKKDNISGSLASRTSFDFSCDLYESGFGHQYLAIK